MNNANFKQRSNDPPGVISELLLLRNGGNALASSCSWSSLSPRSATFVMFSCMIPTLSLIWAESLWVGGFLHRAGWEKSHHGKDKDRRVQTCDDAGRMHGKRSERRKGRKVGGQTRELCCRVERTYMWLGLVQGWSVPDEQTAIRREICMREM